MMIDRETRPSSPEPDTLEFVAGVLTFRPRFEDFRWGDRVTCEFVAALGYRIYIGMLDDVWFFVDGARRRYGPYTDLYAAAEKAADFAMREIEAGCSQRDLDELRKGWRRAAELQA